jgi:hypothetical protein
MKRKLKMSILRKINTLVRIVETKDGFQVENRPYASGQWIKNNVYSTFKAALAKKHVLIVMIILRDLGYRGELIKRRTHLKDKKLKNNIIKNEKK